jgi:hypothetical protein
MPSPQMRRWRLPRDGVNLLARGLTQEEAARRLAEVGHNAGAAAPGVDIVPGMQVVLTQTLGAVRHPAQAHKDRDHASPQDGKPAPRSIRHVFGVMSTMFKDAVADELIRSSPCVLRKGVLPKKMDKDPEWRATAIFDRDELIRFVSDRSIPQDRRVLYAFKGLAGLRHGEAARLRFEQITSQIEPPGSIHLGKTKSGVPRAIPIHPVLQQILEGWAEAGWERIFGRAPVPGDLIVPTRNMTVREFPRIARGTSRGSPASGPAASSRTRSAPHGGDARALGRRRQARARGNHARPPRRHRESAHDVPLRSDVPRARKTQDRAARAVAAAGFGEPGSLHCRYR